MFRGENSAFASKDYVSEEVTQPSVAFVGSSLSFSDQIIRIANIEFEGVAFKRYDTIADFRASNAAQGNLIAVIVEEALAGQLGDLLEMFQELEATCQVVLGYRDAKLAVSVFQKLSGQGDQCEVSYLPMGLQFDIWLSVLRLLLCGGKFIPVEMVADMSGGPEDSLRIAHADAGLSEWTEREREVLALVSEGKPNKTIATELDLSEHTIKLHIHHVINKLGVRNRTEAAILFLGGGRAA